MRLTLSAILLLVLAATVQSLVHAAPPAPAGHWKVEAEAGQLAARLPGQDVASTKKGSAQAFENRSGWTPAQGAQYVAPAVGDGWTALTVVVDVFVANLRGNYQALVCRDRWGGPTGDVFGLVVTPDGRWMARVKTAAGQCALTAPATTGWHLLAMTYDATHARLFVDGRLAAEKAHSGTMVAEPKTALAFGTYSGSANGILRGALREVRIWSTALSAENLAEFAKTWRAELKETRAKGFWFAEAADTHVTDTKSVEIVNDGVDSINADRRVDFSLWLGDMTRAATPDEMVLARLALQRLTKPRYVLRGNHDQRPGVYEKEFGELRQRIEHGGWVFLLIDTNPGDKTPINQTEHNWIREQLKTIDADTPIVLCTHHPLMPHTKSYLIAGASEVLALFTEHNLKACLSGHYHGNQEETVDGVLFTTTACLSTTRNNFDGTKPKGYRVFHCEEDRITSEFVPVPKAPQ
ncbi:MAG: metallophosphoesterase [Lentisphaeria bacterium]|nr:metallophosphoesterase [Lentisphaeria bacterium]